MDGESRVGQLKISGVLSSEPAGTPLRECARGECVVTYDAGEDDRETQRRYGVIGLRRARLLRISTEALDGGIDLTQEGLAQILGAGLKTVKRDIAYFRRVGISVPTRGQQKDLGPFAPHQVETVRLTLDGLTESEISRRILHAPGDVSRILRNFSRAVSLLRENRSPEEVASLVELPRRLVEAYADLATDAARDGDRSSRLEDMLRVYASRRAAPEDVSSARRERALRRLRASFFDEQVKVLRRRVFEFLFDSEVRRAARYSLSLTLLVVEPAGREVVPRRGRALVGMTVAERLRTSLRATDLIGRAALARYYVLLPFSSPVEAERVMERLTGPQAAQGASLQIGAACFPAHGSRPGDLLRGGVRALARARALGHAYSLASTPAAALSGGTGV